MSMLGKAMVRLTEKKGHAYEIAKELMWDRYYDSSSWFLIGHFEAEGHKLNYLYHQMIWMDDKTGEPYLNSVVSVTDETTGYYRGEDKFYPMSQTQIADDRFRIVVPNGSMEGDIQHLHVTASMERLALDVELDIAPETIYNGGSGIFSLAVVDVHQYSKPRITPKGTLTIDGKSYTVAGEAWFDRQWQKMPRKKGSGTGKSNDPVTNGTIHWYWMDLNMDAGDKLSLWCVEIGRLTRAWATVLDAKGNQEVVDVVPFGKYPAKRWLSSASGQNYPVEFTVNIPSLDANLSVTPYPTEQEIASEHISKYEAASRIHGTYRGKPASGFCYVELVGRFL